MSTATAQQRADGLCGDAPEPVAINGVASTDQPDLGILTADRLNDSLLCMDDDFWNGAGDLEEWLVAPFLARGRGHLLYAAGKSGKSLFALWLAARAALGRAVLNEPARPGGIRVLYVDAEMTPSDVRERLEDMGLGPDDDLSNLIYYSLPALSPLNTPHGGGELVALAKHHAVDLVVVDTISKVVHGEENSNDTAIGFAQYCGTPMKAAGIALLRIDHAGKEKEKGARGGSAKVDDVDVVWRLAPKENRHFTLEATHRRITWVPEKVELVRVQDVRPASPGPSTCSLSTTASVPPTSRSC